MQWYFYRGDTYTASNKAIHSDNSLVYETNLTHYIHIVNLPNAPSHFNAIKLLYIVYVFCFIISNVSFLDNH